MSHLENALIVSNLTRIIVDMQEKKGNIIQLNKYDHTVPGTSYAPFSIKFGGRSTRVSYFPKNNEIGDAITTFFVDIFSKIEAEAEQKLSKLLLG